MNQVLENAVVLTYSEDKKQLLTENGKVFAQKNQENEHYKLVFAENHETQLEGCMQVRVCVGLNAKGTCIGWSIETVCN